MVSSYVIKVFDLVDPDDPVLARERLFQSAELRALLWESGAADSVLSLTRREERIIVVVGHFVPST